MYPSRLFLEDHLPCFEIIQLLTPLFAASHIPPTLGPKANFFSLF